MEREARRAALNPQASWRALVSGLGGGPIENLESAAGPVGALLDRILGLEQERTPMKFNPDQRGKFPPVEPPSPLWSADGRFRGWKVAADSKETIRIVLDDVLPKWNSKANQTERTMRPRPDWLGNS